MNKRLFLSVSIVIHLWIVSFQKIIAQDKFENCVIKTETNWGVKYGLCTSRESFAVVLKDTCNIQIDVVCAVLDKSGEWKVFSKDYLNKNDTMIAYTCEGEGKYQLYYRLSNSKETLPRWEDLNKDLMAKRMLNKLTTVFAKILFGSTTKKPMVNQEVELQDKEGVVLEKSTTDKNGDFGFTKIDSTKGYSIVISKPVIKLLADESVYLAKTNGKVLKAFNKDGKGGYEYKILPADIANFSKMDETEDPDLQVKEFGISGSKEMMISKNIYYPSGSFQISEPIKNDLTTILKTLLENKNLSIEIYSYTDALGDDKANMELSQKRVLGLIEYFHIFGIERNRIIGKGMGETKIINKCLNGVTCSEEEHRINRRTEFKFVKK